MPQEKVNHKVVLVSVAHPDDADYSCAGSVAKWAQEGSAVYYLICTSGNKGSSDLEMTPDKLAKVRRGEQVKAAKILGVREVFFLNHNDGELEPTLKLKEEIVKVIRETKPTLVVTMDPTMRYSEKMGYINHPDHIAAGEATLAAVFPLARDRLAFPNHERLGIRPHAVREVLLVHFDEPNFYVDISQNIGKKIEALRIHKSQTGSNFSEIGKMMLQWAAQAGKKINAKYAEAFKKIILSF